MGQDDGLSQESDSEKEHYSESDSDMILTVRRMGRTSKEWGVGSSQAVRLQVM